MGQTDNWWERPFNDSGDDLPEPDYSWLDKVWSFSGVLSEYPNETTCDMCGKDNGAVLRSDGAYRCSHCDMVWNG